MLLTESQEAHEEQDHHSVQKAAGVADGGHRSAGSSGGGRTVDLIPQQVLPVLEVRHVRLFGGEVYLEEVSRATHREDGNNRSYDTLGESRDRMTSLRID